MTITELAEEIGKGLKDKENMKTNLIKPGIRNSRFLISNYKLKVRSTRCLVESRAIGTAFILGHSSNGVLGTSALGAGTMGSWTTVETISTTQELADAGKTEIAKWLNLESANIPDKIAIGTDDTAFTTDDTALGSELDNVDLGGIHGSYDVTNDAKIIYQVEVKSTDSTIIGNTAKEVGLIGEGDELFARYVISNLAMASTHNYRFTIDLELWDNSIGNAVIPTTGLNQIRNAFGNSSGTGPNYWAFGAGTTTCAATDDYLEFEIERNAVTSHSRDGFKIRYETLLAASEAPDIDISKSGAFTSAEAKSSTQTIDTSQNGEEVDFTV